MNGKKAKMFRKLAGVNKDNTQNRSYHGEKDTVRVKNITHPHALDNDGQPLVLGKYQTATYRLNQGAQLLNKMLKKNYLQVLRSPTKGMLVA